MSRQQPLLNTKVRHLPAYLISVPDGVPENTRTLSAGLHLQLNENWKTYWRSAGEVGIPPSVEWSGSENVADVEFMWPAPTRFTAFGIENFGYAGDVVFPLRITLKDPGAPVTLSAQVKLLVCSNVCVPEEFDLSLRLGRGNVIDSTSAGLIGTFSRARPRRGQDERRQRGKCLHRRRPHGVDRQPSRR